MTDEPTDQAEHARIFCETSKAVTAVAVAFAKGVQPVLSAEDCARIYTVAAVTLAIGAMGDVGAAAMLRRLADDLESGAPTPN